MKSKNTSENRRKLLKSIAAGSGVVVAGKSLPNSWSRPVVDSVMLPAHARTSTSFSGSTTVQQTMLEPDSFFAQAVDVLLPDAAAKPPLGYIISWCVIPVNDTQADVTVLVYADNIFPPYSADLYTGRAKVGDTTDLVLNSGCSGYTDAGDLLNNLGLIKDAKATCTGTIKLTGLNTGDPFTFDPGCNQGEQLDGTLSIGSNCPTAIPCTK